MVAYNFQSRFVEPIDRGIKTQTIRRVGKRIHAKPGDKLQLYTRMRTKECTKILDATCLSRHDVLIDVESSGMRVCVDGSDVTDLEKFATADGFRSFADFHGFWLRNHGKLSASPFYLIKWAEDDYGSGPDGDGKPCSWCDRLRCDGYCFWATHQERRIPKR